MDYERDEEIERCIEFLKDEGFIVIDRGDISDAQFDEHIECGCHNGCDSCLGTWL